MFVRGVNAKDETAELGLVETEPRLEFTGLMERPDPVWKLISHFHTKSANLCRFSGKVDVKKMVEDLFQCNTSAAGPQLMHR